MSDSKKYKSKSNFNTNKTNNDLNPYHITESEKKKMEKKNYASTYGELTSKGLKQMLKYVDTTENKVFADLGSGSGNVVINAIKSFPKLKKSIGIEFSKHRHTVALNNFNKLTEPEKKKIKLYNDDLFNKSVKTFDIMYISNLCFTEETNKKLAIKLNKEVKPNTNIFCSKPINLKNSSSKYITVEQSWNPTSSILFYKIKDKEIKKIKFDNT